jgi:hypothetical protein
VRAEVMHDHPEGIIKGAQAVAAAILYMNFHTWL